MQQGFYGSKPLRPVGIRALEQAGCDAVYAVGQSPCQVATWRYRVGPLVGERSRLYSSATGRRGRSTVRVSIRLQFMKRLFGTKVLSGNYPRRSLIDNTHPLEMMRCKVNNPSQSFTA